MYQALNSNKTIWGNDQEKLFEDLRRFIDPETERVYSKSHRKFEQRISEFYNRPEKLVYGK